MFHIVLYEPEIPPNTGNIIRLCANSGSKLHLIHPLGFKLDDKRLRRAGLDYHEWADVGEYDSLREFMSKVAPSGLYACSTKAARSYANVSFSSGNALLFGPESRGLPHQVLNAMSPEERIRIPMVPGRRSLNLSNAVSLILYEAWRQIGYEGGL
ncbi:MAG: tRNA (cytidine(34)-2'-O)-methyltransferase [Candidatus Thiodiazotropha sp. (ex Lucinoma aequizonata)]|nr:tRNA (cytidine(34)-2'-O)-methyltransferase [Candidatus Thiodiazotropha sp. (ex Lucinoma aequizonata)]MCU7886967.1 tRNA (cytidine(34)-2'-O)-methyltransferase [Candidatus Thiodiazotropha sp. (ex Lucinoma aequizonata)]MCU7894847.1 tRNA (cytidine(34)-2'-O)-methyltransferase [Candidatus Thiodiazotropha sp. (ex Lucinoma aequizonata)]MCU7898630.1 tRNA (cytidine(34)-2'-O)-methyltransferase [Candidatus Thiodiazotropha sp. (ex Lucinoma aequizonata)]MCU7902948.1 tRNA (cytidine(34)-2'-O)-methyltransfera